jgi:hypothetical protein
MSVYNPQIPQSFLQELENMSTDIRQQKKDIADAKAAAQAAQGTANNALNVGQVAQSVADAAASALQVISGTIETISAEMVRKFNSDAIPQSAFVLDPVTGYFYATVSHMLGDVAPDIEVYDADKDKQRIQSIIVDNNTIKLELDSEDMASNSFPLTCIVLGKNAPDSPVTGAWEPMPGGDRDFRLLNGNLENTTDMGVTFNLMGTDIVEAFICTQESKIYAKNQAGEHFSFAANGAYFAQEEVNDYLSRKALADSIALV